jgi:tryptophan synthase alpha chain
MANAEKTPSKGAPKLLAHLIAGFPDWAASERLARTLADSGADALEIQFPFSDPTADGPLIEEAVQKALADGFRVDEGFRLVKKITESVGIPVFIMTYASLAFARSIRQFASDSAWAGAVGLIIPDLPFDCDEGLKNACDSEKIAFIPVVSPVLSDIRMKEMAALKPSYVYTALRSGITGQDTALEEDTLSYLRKLSHTGAKIFAGFGIVRREQMIALSGLVYGAAAGSCFLRAMNKARDNGQDPIEAARILCESLSGKRE